MHVHFCGNLAHDIPMGILGLLSFAPDWAPMVAGIRANMRARLSRWS